MPRLLTAAVFSVLIVSTGYWWISGSEAPVAMAQNSQPQLIPAAKSSVPTTVPTTIPAPQPAANIYTAKRGDSIPLVARQFLRKSSYLTSEELAEAIREANGDHRNNILRAGETLTIPGLLDAPIVEKTIPVPKDFEVRAIYLTGVMAGSERGMRIVKRWREVGGNAVVFDIKDSDGIVNIAFDHALAVGSQKHYISDLPKYARFLHAQGMHAIARIAIFRDEKLVLGHPELAVQSARAGKAWRENGKLVWTDPSQPKVQEYDIALAKFVAESGVDEIQFDYVRFPAEGDQKDAVFHFQSANPTWHRSDVIADFLKHAHEELKPTGVLLSLDVFGIMAWQRPVDLAHTGQDIVRMAQHCDVLSPMIYPSHFFGMDGVERPGDAPEHFIGESMARFQKITSGSGVVIRPWLQAFAWRTKTYSPKYIETQVRVAKEKNGIGFLFWNANNDYSKPYIDMPEMAAAKGQYFRGDEVVDRKQPVVSSNLPSTSPAK